MSSNHGYLLLDKTKWYWCEVVQILIHVILALHMNPVQKRYCFSYASLLSSFNYIERCWEIVHKGVVYALV